MVSDVLKNDRCYSGFTVRRKRVDKVETAYSKPSITQSLHADPHVHILQRMLRDGQDLEIGGKTKLPPSKIQRQMVAINLETLHWRYVECTSRIVPTFSVKGEIVELATSPPNF
ncbi:hypothetical protein TNCV_2529061 [Trichonephila clavipes]|nr:hypothetical protein TNCV_2529061 [Trichonephila clavipes]